jgi:hypothetical protein
MQWFAWHVSFPDSKKGMDNCNGRDRGSKWRLINLIAHMRVCCLKPPFYALQGPDAALLGS